MSKQIMIKEKKCISAQNIQQIINLLSSLFILGLLLFPLQSFSAVEGSWQDITSKVSVTKSNPIRSRRNPDATVVIQVTNSSNSDLSGPFRFIITGLDPSTGVVEIGNETGLTTSGESYFDLTPYINSMFVQGATSDQIRVKISGGGRNLFAFNVRVEQEVIEEPVPELAVEIISPLNLSVVESSPVQIEGTISDPSATLTVNGVEVIHANGAFSASVALEEGENNIVVRAVAADTSEVTDSIDVILETPSTIPDLTVKITSPATLITVGSSPLAIQGTVNEPSATLTVNGVEVEHNNGDFITSVALDQGHNTVLVRLVDANGFEVTDSISVVLDTTPPEITIQSPIDGSIVNEATIAVSGQVNDIVQGTVSASQATVIVNGKTAVVKNRTYQAEGVVLTEDENTITVTGTDAQGNTASKTIVVTFEVLTAQRIELLSGQSQTAKIRSLLPVPLKVKLLDGNEQPVEGAKVVYRVIQGDGQVSTEAGDEGQGVLGTTDAEGESSVQFKLGSHSGQGIHRVSAKAVGYDGEIIFRASAETNSGDKVSINSGNNQRGAPNQPLPLPLVIAVTDSGANLVQGEKVEFKVIKGGGQFQNGQISTIATTDSDGRAAVSLTLGADVGLDVHGVTATLVGTSLNAGFTASALQPADPGLTSITGLVFDNQDNPLVNVTIRIEGSNRQAVTDALGKFKITEAPVGPVHLIVDGSTTTSEGEWPTLSYNIVTIAGAINPLSAPVYMVKLDTENAVYVGKEDKALTLSEVPGFKLEVKAGSVTFPGGAKEGLLSVTPVNSSKVPMAPPNGMQPQFIVTIQPAGAKFDPPAPLTLPNVDGHLPGAQVEMYSFDHDLEQFVSIGLGTVSKDGTVVSSNTGIGVIKAGWHCGSQPTGQGCCGGGSGAGSCPTCKKPEKEDCSSGKCVNDDSQDPGECKTCSGGTPVPDDSKKPKGKDAVCKQCDNGSVVANESANGSKCSDDLKQQCYTCKDGSCANNCQILEPAVSHKISADGNFVNLSGLLKRGINKIPYARLSLSDSFSGTNKVGTECCKNCTDETSSPFPFQEVTGEGSIAGTITVVIPGLGALGDIESPKFGPSWWYYQFKASYTVGVFIEGKVDAKANIKYKNTSCPDDDNCFTGNIGSGLKLSGGVTGRVSAAIEEWYNDKLVDKDGIGGKVEGRAVTGISVQATKVFTPGGTCGADKCEWGHDGVKLEAEVSLKADLLFFSEEFSFVVSKTVVAPDKGPC